MRPDHKTRCQNRYYQKHGHGQNPRVSFVFQVIHVYQVDYILANQTFEDKQTCRAKKRIDAI